jgi:hypothetical protein
MGLDGELINLILYCVQQAGIALGFGAQTIMLVAYIRAAKDRVVDEKESQFLSATHWAIFAALMLIITSGVGIAILHFAAGQTAVLFAPAFLFKWLLIGVVLVLTLMWRAVPQKVNEAVLGGSWYALFLVHILAPVANWVDLFILWGAWMVGFVLVWSALVVLSKDPKQASKTSEAKAIEKPVEPKVILPTKPVLKNPDQAPGPAPFVKLDPPKRDIPTASPPPPLAPPPAAVPVAKSTPQVAPTVPASPAQRVTDKPFLPQVPPLEPIPVIAPPTQAPGAPTVVGAGIPQNPKDAPKLQQPEQIGAVSQPQDGLSHVQVMPKSPDQIK